MGWQDDVDWQEEPEPPPGARPSWRQGAAAAVRAVRPRLRRAAGGLSARVQGWDERSRATSFVSAAENVVIDARRHPFLLVAPVLRTVAGLLVLATGLDLLLVLLLAVMTAAWARQRHEAALRTTATVAGVAAAAVVALDLLVGPWLVVLVLLLWLLEDTADWHTDRLVVTDKRIYRRHGVLTRHSPSISLTAIAYIDAAVPPVGRLLRYGTLRLDSVAQRDAPLSRFDLIPDVVQVSHEILRLRTKALPTFPQQPL